VRGRLATSDYIFTDISAQRRARLEQIVKDAVANDIRMTFEAMIVVSYRRDVLNNTIKWRAHAARARRVGGGSDLSSAEFNESGIGRRFSTEL
jgi:hypothetical protein